ncbi:hypothetical protein CLU79DRAFT_326752 [Phycomyces nitens]|nr:hypothetical protein CLU79DRAFT_326752 [Phycomyces nitens]
MTLSVHPLRVQESTASSSTFITTLLPGPHHPIMASVIPSSNTEPPTPQTPSHHPHDTPPSSYAPSDLPFPRQTYPQQRAYSVTAMPHELQRTVQRQQQQQAEQQQRQLQEQPWWQYYYQLYHYHPPLGRKPTVFGPYLLLQTLGEGEFGKVKLAIHIETGHEVAIKLIKKDNIDSSTRMTKVEREISVLKTVRHPYIVKLYDVIETEKYIGIILQCASGGELFEYILAHRYLKEKDASRLFAQLISGVHYMHQKHIVHRDLKLENLLLDRHRSIIITDFGFANQFSSSRDDLMSTSCGSPCYAAPELVISEGLYVGSAVDIWSCGVILYAMLCGYLPFDDDPANPDGDNINLLYKYILNTPLAFPDYISAEARDLLQKMLVPDPVRRCTMDTIMNHAWLSPHRSLFERSTAELEVEAMRSADLPMHMVLSNPQRSLPDPVDTTRRNTIAATYTHPTDAHAPVEPKIHEEHEEEAVVPTMSMDIDLSEQPKDNNVQDTIMQDAPSQDAPTLIQEPKVQTIVLEAEDQSDLTMEVATETVVKDPLPTIVVKETDSSKPRSVKSVTPVSEPSPAPSPPLPPPSPSDAVTPTHPANNPGTHDTNDTHDTHDPHNQDISSFELPAAHQEVPIMPDPVPVPSPSKTTNKILHFLAAHSQSTPRQNPHQSPSLIPTTSTTTSSVLSNAANPPRKSSARATRPHSMMPESQVQTGSILQAKFLSSIQRNPRPEGPTPGPGGVSMSTPFAPKQPQQQQQQQQQQNQHQHQQNNQSSTARVTPQPTIGTSHPVRGTRRKALSLLVNSMTDYIGHDDNAKRAGAGGPPQAGKRTMPFARRNTRQQPHNPTQAQQSESRIPEPKPVESKTTVEAKTLERLIMMPSVSEQSVTASTLDKEKHRSAGKKIMDWFKKKPQSNKDTNGSRLGATAHANGSDLHPSHPVRAMQIGKPLGSYAVDFNDSKLRTHHGAVDQDALTSRPPHEVFVQVKQALGSMGIDVKRDGEYKLKCTRRKRKITTPPPSTSSGMMLDQRSQQNRRQTMTEDQKKRRMSSGTPLRMLLRRTSGATTSVHTSPDSSSDVIVEDMTGSQVSGMSGTGETVYGDPVVDSGEEVRFSVELCKIKNLPGLYIVDIRRMKGSVWAYKCIYHTLLETLDLSGKGGYMSTHAPQEATTPLTPRPTDNRKDTESNPASSKRVSTVSSGASSSVLEDVIKEEV